MVDEAQLLLHAGADPHVTADIRGVRKGALELAQGNWHMTQLCLDYDVREVGPQPAPPRDHERARRRPAFNCSAHSARPARRQKVGPQPKGRGSREDGRGKRETGRGDGHTYVDVHTYVRRFSWMFMNLQ